MYVLLMMTTPMPMMELPNNDNGVELDQATVSIYFNLLLAMCLTGKSISSWINLLV
jgi:hypothetical protein